MSGLVKFGCCLNMAANDSDSLGINNLETLASSGYDYAELPLAQIMDLDDTEFEAVLNRLKRSGIPCEACNNFFPASVKLTGPAASLKVIGDYADKSLERANALGAKVIVFGSSGARNVEIGFDMDKAFEQLKDALLLISDKAKDYGINIAIECLNKKESNIINSLTEGAKLAKAVNRPNIGNLIDLYHMEMENEPVEVIKRLHEAGTVFIHAHIADTKTGRGFPLIKARFKAFADMLMSIGYSNRISVEGYTEHFSDEIKLAEKTLNELFNI